MPATPHSPPSPTAATLRQRLPSLLQALQAGLLERGTAVRLALLAALAGEHVLLIGPPGTAKSELARRLHRAFAGARWFERLLTRFSTPEELFGPLSLKALEDDRYERLIDGYLPTAGVAFLDEVFKANSAILNTLLTLLNEREYDHGAGRIRTPLLSVVGASNEVPTDEALQAFYDRFLLRVPVAPVSSAAFGALMALRDEAAAPLAALQPITESERDAVAAARATVALGEDTLAALQRWRQACTEQGLPVSDRRWRQLGGLLRTAAASEGRARVALVDLWLAPYVLAQQPSQLPALQQWLAEQVLQAVPQDASGFERAVLAFEQQLAMEQAAPAEEQDAQAGKLAVVQAVGGSAGGDMPRIRSARLEAQQRRRFSSVHIAARLAQLHEVAADIARAQADVQARRDDLAAQCSAHLWLPPECSEAWLGAHAHSLGVLAALRQRVAACSEGFAALPQDDEAPATAPGPVAWQ